MLLSLDGDGSLTQRLVRALRAEILARRLLPGSRLPSTRTLAHDLGLSRNVAILAYDQLLGEGYAEARRGSGTFVASTFPEAWQTPPTANAGRQRHSRPARLSRWGGRAVAVARERSVRWDLRPASLPYDFRFGRPAFGDFPHAAWRRLLGRRARAAGVRELDYGPPEGRLELREALAARLRRSRGIDADPDHIVVVNGSQQALDLVARVLLDPGDRVLIEEPHYLGARSVFAAAGAKMVPAPVDEDGMRIPTPPARGPAPRLAYVTPSHQFPTGVVLPVGRRLQLLNWATATGAFVLEDDYDSEYRYEGRPLQALASLDVEGRVIYVGTFSKLMFPALRLGYLVLPPPLLEPIVTAKAIADTGTAVLAQLTLADFIRHGQFERHLQRSRRRNASRRATLLRAIHEQFGARAEISGANAGLHVLAWIERRGGGPIDAVVHKAEAVGVGLYTVSSNYLRPPNRTGVLLGYGSLRERDIREGIRRLASAIG